ncbi:MAG TPA: CaiB/BaiF CoA-transferase family protein [Acidimicrobiales bacterium]|nr:CaiB/BaiF CoA-transferase family protein [Acidimicrobiales bacterium]
MPGERPTALLTSVRIVECSMLGPGAITTPLADLGADVIKVEPPQGDYVREMTWPIVEGVSLMHLQISRGKRSVVLDLRTDGGRAVFLDLVRSADAVVEAMRPGGLARRGLGFEDLQKVNPRIVFCTISGYGMTGPYRDLPSHGIAYDTWAGVVTPEMTPEGFPGIPEHVSIGINAGPLYGALAILAGITQARADGVGSQLEVAQSDAAAAMDWLRSTTWRAYERPEEEVTGNKADGYERRAPGTAGMRDGVRYQIYESTDGFVMLMASEQAFWKAFCEGVGRPDLFERWPGSKFADHAKGNLELRAILAELFAERSTQAWIDFAGEHNVPIAPVNSPKSLAQDPQFQDRLSWLPASELVADLMPNPIKVVGQAPPTTTRAPTLGQHTDEVLTQVLGYDAAHLAELRQGGALG